MAKKKKHEEHFDEGWLLPYSDLMTLLLAVFIVLFAVSKVDETKMKEMSSAFKNIALSGGSGLLEGQTSNEDMDDTGSGSTSDDATTTYTTSITKIKMNMDEYIKENNLTNEISTEIYKDNLKITLANNILYQSGSADLSDMNLEIAGKLAKLLADQGAGLDVSVIGHTDNVPIHNNKFADNWELSSVRASNFLRNMLSSQDLSKCKFLAGGRGESEPIASNDTEEGRSQNRRVEVLIQEGKDRK